MICMIELIDVCYEIENQCIFEQVNYQFDKGIYIVQGESGIGKTTLLNIIYGYKNPSSGIIHIQERTKMQYLFQEDMIFQNLTLLENFFMKCDAIGMVEKRMEKIQALCIQYGIKDKLNCKVCTLSGGERKRAQIAMLGLEEFDVLLLDEPIANLDPQNSNIIIQLLLEMKDKTIIIVSHQKIELADKCVNLIKIKDKKLYEVRNS